MIINANAKIDLYINHPLKSIQSGGISGKTDECNFIQKLEINKIKRATM